MRKTKPFLVPLALLSLCLPAFFASAQKKSGKISGGLKRWHRVTLTFDGPQTSEDATLNPFRDHRLVVTFTKGDRQFVVPGFYAADGRAGETGAAAGDQWRTHFTPDQAFSDYLRAVDPYDHPIVIHTFPNRYDLIYDPLLGHATLEGPSLQVHDQRETHFETLKWLDRSALSGRNWVVSLDEIGDAKDGVLTDAEDPEHNDVRHYVLWGNLIAGGAGAEWYFGYRHPHHDLNCEDWRSRDRIRIKPASPWSSCGRSRSPPCTITTG